MYQQVSAPSHTQDMTAIHHPYDERLDAVRDRIAQLTLETKDLVSPEKVYQLKRREVIDVFERDYALNTEKYDDSDEGLRNRAEVFHQHHQKLRLLEHNHTRSAKADTLAFEEKVDRELKTFVKDVWELVWSASGPPNTSSFTPRFKRDSVGIAAETSTNSTPQQSLSPAVDGYSTDLTTTDCEGEGDDDRKTSFIVKLPLPEKLKYGDAAKLSSKTPATRGPRSSSRASVKAPPPPEPERWIDFEDVYQRGQAKTKYRIVSDKRYPGKWYIFRCEEHNRNFMHRPQTAAGKHMTGKDHRCTISGAYFFELGVQVRNCNAALAKLNNDTIPEISELDQKAPRGKGSPIRRRKASSMSTGYEPDTDCDDETSDERLCKYPRHTDRRRMRALGDVNPVPGQVFNVYWPKVKKWYAAVILPKGPFSEIGLSGSMEDTPLLDSLPSCYERDGTSWKCKEGYNDGEPHASEQMYPAMYFDGPHPNVCDYAWLSIKDLEPFDRCTIEVMYRDIAIQHIKGREKQKEDELYDSDAESSGKHTKTTISVFQVQ
jgi:hypothetical protein